MAVCHHLFRHPILNPTLRKMVILAYLLLGFLIFVYVSVLFQVWDHKRKAKSEWEQYWDEVMKKNSNQ